MSRVDVKTLAKLEAKFKRAAQAYSEAEAKTSKSRVSDLDRARAHEAFDSLRAEAIRFVKVLLTGDDGKRWAGQSWLAFIRTNDCPIAAAFDEVVKKPYAAVFANAERNAVVKVPRRRRKPKERDRNDRQDNPSGPGN